MIKVSIIIPTCNRANYLIDTLSTLRMMSETSSAELIVIDNGSTDRTREIVETFTKGSPFPCRYIYEPTPGLHVGRNLGAQLAQGRLANWHSGCLYQLPWVGIAWWSLYPSLGRLSSAVDSSPQVSQL